MVEYNEITDSAKIASFVSGEGIRRLCSSGRAVTDAEVAKAIAEGNNHYIEAVEDGRSLGLVILTPTESAGVFVIHLCLRTIGQHTRDVFRGALNYAKNSLGAKTILAIFPREKRSCIKLADDLGFKDALIDHHFWFKTLQLD